MQRQKQLRSRRRDPQAINLIDDKLALTSVSRLYAVLCQRRPGISRTLSQRLHSSEGCQSGWRRILQGGDWRIRNRRIRRNTSLETTGQAVSPWKDDCSEHWLQLFRL